MKFEDDKAEGGGSAPTPPIADKPKIFVWITGGFGSDVICAAMAEDGTVLAGHMSSSEGWAQHDMGVIGDWKHDEYRKHYPNGYEVVWIGVARRGHVPPEFEAAYQRHLAAAPDAPRAAPSGQSGGMEHRDCGRVSHHIAAALSRARAEATEAAARKVDFYASGPVSDLVKSALAECAIAIRARGSKP